MKLNPLLTSQLKRFRFYIAFYVICILLAATSSIYEHYVQRRLAPVRLQSRNAQQVHSKDLQRIKALQEQVEAKDAQNAQEKARSDDLNKQLQAKRDAQAESARVAAIPQAPVYSGYGGGASPTYSGNTYAPLNCTWYVASLKNVPSNLGNANTWDDMALMDGGSVSYVPFVGAIAQTDAGWAGHVALTVAVTSTTVTVREMNFYGLGVVDERTTPISDWKYIYF